MKPTPFLLLICAAAAGLFAGCAVKEAAPVPSNEPAPKVVGPTLESRLSPKWHEGASCIWTPKLVVYYHGTAEGAYSADGNSWQGTIQGDILVLSDGGAVLVPNGMIRLEPGGHLGTDGQSSTIICSKSECPWRHLLLKPAKNPDNSASF